MHKKKELRIRSSMRGTMLYSAGAVIAGGYYTGRLLGHIRVEHEERFPAWPQGLLLYANHPSLYEPQLLYGLFAPYFLRRGLRYAPFSTPDYGNYCERGCFAWAADRYIPVPRGDPRGELRALALMQRALRARLNLILFPEGGRTAKGDEFVYSASGRYRVRRFKEGIGQLVARTGCATLPVWVEGADKALPIGSAIPRVNQRVTLRVGVARQYERRVFTSRHELRVAAREATQQLCTDLLAVAEAR